jgi:ribokinase
MQKGKILVVGSLNMDLVVEVTEMPKVGQTILGSSFKTIPGGKGANQAFAAGRLGGDVTMIGSVGSDDYGKSLIQSLRGAGVKTDGVEVMQAAHTGLAFIYVNSAGNNSIVVVSGANGLCTGDIIDKYIELVKQSDIIIVQFEIPMNTVRYLLDIAKRYNKLVILNPAPAPDEIPDEIIEKIDIITPNETELETLSGYSANSLENIVQAARQFIIKGVKSIIVTWGDKGAVLIDKDRYKHFPAGKVKAIDTTAAGDSFTAAVAVALSEGRDIDEAIGFANKVASIVVTRQGAQTSIPSREEVDI